MRVSLRTFSVTNSWLFTNITRVNTNFCVYGICLPGPRIRDHGATLLLSPLCRFIITFTEQRKGFPKLKMRPTHSHEEGDRIFRCKKTEYKDTWSRIPTKNILRLTLGFLKHHDVFVFHCTALELLKHEHC